jgi:hypothetical protein
LTRQQTIVLLAMQVEIQFKIQEKAGKDEWFDHAFYENAAEGVGSGGYFSSFAAADAYFFKHVHKFAGNSFRIIERKTTIEETVHETYNY